MPKEPDVKKAGILPKDLWKQCETHINGRETDFSKLCRTALRFYLREDRITDSLALEVKR